MTICSAGYLGGLPSQTKALEDGQLVVDSAGMRFVVTVTENMIPKAVTAFTIPQDELRGVTVGGGAIKRKGMLAAVAMGGIAGAATHKATRGRQTTPVAVLVEQAGHFATCRFATDANSAQELLAALNDSRRNSGRAPLPPVESIG